ncbi:ATP-dependent DNA helicase PIF1-like [Leguminivora glycinivorella]|uniref:ATP-dependent DNA helicase PIF1-like n=1 Tax=Leguminivora glycinivorella TaxID=1035111 RepID=UPI00200D8C6C|nr:ATP-dependent DNA helicase PIF1-like [Leguminivora glycinivorella]
MRPDELAEISLAEFAVRFESVSNSTWSEEDGDLELRDDEAPSSRFIRLLDNTRMRIRNKSAVLRTRYFTLNSDKEAYYYSLIVCHVPFREESELLLEGETAEACFIRRQRELRPLQRNVSVEEFAHAEQVIQQALVQAVALNAARDTHNNNDDPPPVICDGEQIMNDDDNYCEDVSETSAMPDDVFLGNIRGLNVQQKDLFQKVSVAVEKDLQGEEEQLLMFITGGAGSGKSFVLKLLVEHIKRCYAPTVDILLKAKFVEVGSLTGVAARQILGKTLHSIFCLPIEKSNTMNYAKISGQRLENERRKWRHIHWLIIDEISMVSYENLRIIHLRLQEFKNNNKLFGGVHILLFGDILQLPPVKGHWCFIQPPRFSAEVNLWQQFSFCELTINMRQRNDLEFIELLNSLRVGDLTTAQLQLLCERRHVPLAGDFADGAAVRIFPTVRQVDGYNDKMTTENAKVQRVYTFNAVDESRETATYGKKPPENVIPKDVNNCGGFLPTIKLGVESRVMLRRNISVSDGLVNGAMGILKKIKWPALRRDQLEEGELPEAVLIKFDDATIGAKIKDNDGCVAISPASTTFQALRGYGDVERRMLPIILSWAVTVHKLQGTTLDKAVIDLGKKNFAKGQTYVALSRVKTLEGIVLSDLDANKLLNRPHDEKALKEMLRLRNLP